MAEALHARFGSNFVGVLAIDRKVSRLRQMQSRIKKALVMSSLERRVTRIERQLAQQAEHIFSREAAPPDNWPLGVNVHTTADPNDTESVAWMAQRRPDLITVTGAPILKPHLFDLATIGTLNMHSSLLPDYRGTQAEFWQILEGRLDTCGLTIHFVDAGVDTGKIVQQHATSITQGTSPQMLRTYNLLAALDVVPEAVGRVLQGGVEPKPQGQGGRARRGKDKTLEYRARLLTGLGYPGMHS
jgi:methionyl-tRNA formyltransferase